MNKGNIIWLVLLVGIVAGFFLGKWKGRNETQDLFIDNPTLVKEIAELAVLEVDGNAKLSESNTNVSKSFWNDLTDFLGERTLNVEVPYVAKYGTKLSKSDVKIVKKKNKQVVVEIEKPVLLSLEIRLDRLQQFSKNGVFVFQKDDKLKLPVQKLYSETKKKLEKNTANIALAKKNIEDHLNQYYLTLGIEATYQWKM